jgi:transcriptional regulator with XRE-family HTH domain
VTEWRKLREEILADPQVREEYERLRPQHELASRLIALRKTLDLSQRDLARAAGMRQPQIARIETGESSPTWATLSRIFEAVGAEVEVTLRMPGGKKVKV